MEQTIEILCEKLGVTVDYLVNELYKHSVTLDCIGIVFWTLASVITVILTVKFKSRWEKAIEENEWNLLFIIIPIVVGIFALIIIPSEIVDLISWHISPISQAIKVLTK